MIFMTPTKRYIGWRVIRNLRSEAYYLVGYPPQSQQAALESAAATWSMANVVMIVIRNQVQAALTTAVIFKCKWGPVQKGKKEVITL